MYSAALWTSSERGQRDGKSLSHWWQSIALKADAAVELPANILTEMVRTIIFIRSG